jgi:serine protease Do
MLKKCFLLLLGAGCSLSVAQAETIQLKDKAAVTGKILAEKRDQVVVDLGFTVLSVPRNQITRITRTDVPEVTAKPAVLKTVVEAEPKPAAEARMGFYSVLGTRPSARSVRELVNSVGEAVVQVRTPGGLGSGFIINEEGFLMTNFHVIEGETEITVEVYHQKDGELNRKSYKQVRIIAMNKFADLALLKIEDRDCPKFKYVSLGSTEVLSVGDSVFAVGSPLGLERTVTEGIVSTKTRPMGGELYLQTTAQINPGNSGGPLFNLAGEVIGVTNMKITFGEGLGFAIPIDGVKFFLDHRDAFAYSTDNPSNPYHYLQPPSHISQPAAGLE